MLRVKDLDFERGQIHVRAPKGRRDRHTMLQLAVPLLQHHLEIVRSIHEDDLREGFGSVWLPEAIERKIPSAPRAWGRQWVFPATSRGKEPSGLQRRHHLHESVVQRAVKRAAFEAKRRQAGDLPHIPAFLRDPPSGTRPRHPHCPRAPWPPESRSCDTAHAAYGARSMRWNLPHDATCVPVTRLMATRRLARWIVPRYATMATVCTALHHVNAV